MNKRISVLMVLGTFAATLVAPIAAQAGSTGRRNTAIVGTAATVYLLAKGKTTQGLIAGAGSAYAWKRYNDSRRAETRRRAYRYGYGRGYGRGYAYGRKYHAKKYNRHYSSRSRHSRC